MVFLITARIKKIRSKMMALEFREHFLHYKSMGFFPDDQGQLTPQSLVRSGRFSKLVRDVMNVLVTCKNQEDPIKIEGARVLTTFSSV